MDEDIRQVTHGWVLKLVLVRTGETPILAAGIDDFASKSCDLVPRHRNYAVRGARSYNEAEARPRKIE